MKDVWFGTEFVNLKHKPTKGYRSKHTFLSFLKFKTMPLKPEKRKYNFSDGSLGELGDKLCGFVECDLADFAAYGYDPPTPQAVEVINGNVWSGTAASLAWTAYYFRLLIFNQTLTPSDFEVKVQ